MIGPDHYLARLYGGPFDGHSEEIVRTPRKIVVCLSYSVPRAPIIGDYDENPPPWPPEAGVEVYKLDQVDQHAVAHYQYGGFTTVINQDRREEKEPVPS